MKKFLWKSLEVTLFILCGFLLYGCAAAMKGAASGAAGELGTTPSGMGLADWIAFTIAQSVSYGVVNAVKGGIRMKLDKAAGGEGE